MYQKINYSLSKNIVVTEDCYSSAREEKHRYATCFRIRTFSYFILPPLFF